MTKLSTLICELFKTSLVFQTGLKVTLQVPSIPAFPPHIISTTTSTILPENSQLQLHCTSRVNQNGEEAKLAYCYFFFEMGRNMNLQFLSHAGLEILYCTHHTGGTAILHKALWVTFYLLNLMSNFQLF